MRYATGFWYDGRVSERREVTLTLTEDGSLRVRGEGLDLVFPLPELQVDAALGTARRAIRFPDGAAAETSDHQFLDSLQRLQGTGGFFRTVARWEKSLVLAFGALLLLLAAGFCFVRYLVPALATRAAFALPERTEEVIGRETLQILDRVVLKPSRLPEARRRELTSLFSVMKAMQNEGYRYRLEFRSGEGIGANAFALPSGVVVITDSMVKLAKSDAEISAIFAHEMGHLSRRHALRHLMQNSATALLIATVTGDITSFTSLSATLPTLLIDAKYSREFETEADDAAVAYLRKEGIPVQVFADILTRLGDDHDRQSGEKESGFGELLSDHPTIRWRVQRILGAVPPPP